jgi:hypothetical protein
LRLRLVLSCVRAVIDVGPAVDGQQLHGAGGLIDPVHDPVHPSAGTMAASQRPELGQILADGRQVSALLAAPEHGQALPDPRDRVNI